MCDTAAAHVADFVFVGFACGTCGRDHLHKRWFIIFLVNVAGLHAIGKVDGTIFRAEGKSHGQTDTFACNSSFTIDAFAGISRVPLQYCREWIRYHGSLIRPWIQIRS